MKITIERKSFVEALAIGSQMSSKAKGLSILENCKLKVNGEYAIISSYDGEVAITKRVGIVSSEGDFTYCIEPKALLAILRSIKDDNVVLAFDDCICEIIHTRGKQSMPYEHADDYPTPVLDAENNCFSIDSSVMFEWFSEARNFVGVNTLYPALMGVYVYCGNNECGVAATNTEILYHNNKPIDYDGEEFGASLSIKAISALLPMLNATYNVSIMIGSRNISFKTEDSMLVATKPEQPYPNFRRIIPKNQPIQVSVNKDDLLGSIKRSMLMANEATGLLKMSISENSMCITSENPMYSKKAKEECSCNCVGGDIELGLKGNYAISMLNSIESEELVFTLETPQRPIIWCDMLNNQKILLQMPCQTV